MAGRRTSGLRKAALALAGSLALHLGAFYMLSRAAQSHHRLPQQRINVSVVEVEKPKPPEPPPPKPPEPEKPKAKPIPPKVVRMIKPPPEKAPPTPPPPSEQPPPEQKAAPPVVLPGITLESTTGSGGFAVNTGNTLYGDPGTKGHDPADVKPYKAERFVAAAKVTELPRILNRESVDIRKYYPPDAKKAEFEGDVILKLLIDSDGSIARISVVVDPGQGLADAAKLAVREYRFAPGTVDGTPVATTVPFTVHFTLNN